MVQKPFRFDNENHVKLALKLFEFESTKVAGPGSSTRKITDVIWTLKEAIKYMSLDSEGKVTFAELISSLKKQNHLLIIPNSINGEDGYVTRTAETLRIIGHTYEYWHKGRPGVDAIRWEIVPKQIPRRNISPADMIQKLIDSISNGTGIDQNHTNLGKAIREVIQGIANHFRENEGIETPRFSNFQYESVKQGLLDALGHGGKGTVLVAGVGSGGTLTGLAEFFKEKDPSIQIVAADPENSIVADAVIKGSYSYEGGSWLVEGVGEDFIPDNLDLSLIDDAETVTDKEAFEILQVLLQEEGILGGSSTGTLVAGAIKWCKKQTEPKKVVTFICDTGNKYLSKAFNKSWLHDNNLLNKEKAGNLSDLINRRADKGEMITVSQSETLLIAYNRMRSADISQIPVIKDKELLGILDEEDLLLSVTKDQAAFSNSVTEIMTDKLDILQVDASNEELLAILSEGKVAIIYDKDVFIGFITKVDLINHYRNKLNQN